MKDIDYTTPTEKWHGSIPIQDDDELIGALNHVLNIVEIQRFPHASVKCALHRALIYLHNKLQLENNKT